MTRSQPQSDMVSVYTNLIQAERDKIAQSLEAIEDYSEKLRAACAEARVKLIGRS